ncbi:formate acetyltransferase [Enterobacter cancerogenus]|uniref:Formate acetyltransferase n=1 Tax=Enterobacter cancerogenus TaxID=69218 RepID=A0A484WB20_9ENTR|nr:formate acetyltransferase [Enterobacter cancerogenus]
MDWLAVQYISALNLIHYMHDKYSYEASLMALHDRDVYRTMACGIAGLSVAADSLSAIKYATVKPVRDHTGLAVDFVIEGDYPQYGNNDDRVDSIACDLVERFMKKIQALPTYRNAVPTQSIPDHHLERGLRSEDRQHAGWPPRRDTVCTGVPTRCTDATGKGRSPR